MVQIKPLDQEGGMEASPKPRSADDKRLVAAQAMLNRTASPDQIALWVKPGMTEEAAFLK